MNVFDLWLTGRTRDTKETVLYATLVIHCIFIVINKFPEHRVDSYYYFLY